MQNPRQRHDPVRLFLRRLILLILLVLVILGAFGLWHTYQKERASAALDQQAQAQLSELQTRQAQLASDVTSLESERGMEAAVREAYDMGDQGENEVIIVNAASTTPVSQATSSAFKAW